MVVDSNATQAHEQLTLLLSHEISAVITAMRYNSKWAVVPRYYVSHPLKEEDRNEPSRYDDAFRTLLSEIYLHEGAWVGMVVETQSCKQGEDQCEAASVVHQSHSARQRCPPFVADWSAVDPMLYLTPFLSLIKASDVSGPITGAAAVALQRILGSNLISECTLMSSALHLHRLQSCARGCCCSPATHPWQAKVMSVCTLMPEVLLLQLCM
eukprot:1158132-Pelagomonas_calceolata.AAC.2